MGPTDPTLSKNKKIILQNFGQLAQQVTYVRHFFNFNCALKMFIESMISLSQRV